MPSGWQSRRCRAHCRREGHRSQCSRAGAGAGQRMYNRSPGCAALAIITGVDHSRERPGRRSWSAKHGTWTRAGSGRSRSERWHGHSTGILTRRRRGHASEPRFHPAPSPWQVRPVGHRFGWKVPLKNHRRQQQSHQRQSVVLGRDIYRLTPAAGRVTYSAHDSGETVRLLLDFATRPQLQWERLTRQSSGEHAGPVSRRHVRRRGGRAPLATHVHRIGRQRRCRRQLRWS